VHLAGAAGADLLDGGGEQGGAEAVVAQAGADVELLELGERAVVVRRGAQGEQGEAGGVVGGAGEEREDVVAREEGGEPALEVRARGTGVSNSVLKSCSRRARTAPCSGLARVTVGSGAWGR
jgi:hypothetical protein